MTEILLRAIHFSAIFVLVACLVGEYLLMREEMSGAELRRLGRLDLIYGLAAVVVLLAGLGLWLGGVGKAAAFYSANPVFHAKLGLFVFVALISLHPTIFLLRHRSGQGESIRVPASVRRVLRLELALLLPLPFLATAMARGLGLPA